MCFSLASMPSIQQQPVFFAGGRQRTAFGRHVLPRAREELAAGSIGLPKSSATSAWLKSNTSCSPITLDESGVGRVEIFLERGAEDRWVSMHERPDRSRQRDASGPFTCSSGGNTLGVRDATSDRARAG